MHAPAGSADWFDRVLARGRQPVAAGLAGIAVVVLNGVVFSRLEDVIGTAPKALSLMLPVIIVAVVGGRRPAYITAVVAAATFGFIVPPFGSVRVALQQDLVALVVFGIVAVVVSTIVARRIQLLAELDHYHSLLLRSVSHDFRTPLAVIRAASTELLDHPGHDAVARDRLLSLIGGETERLDRLVANLLDLSRIEAGGLEPRRQPVDLAALVEASVQRLGHLTGDVDLTVDIDEDSTVIDADATLIDQLVTNLIENAARHAPPGGRVTVGARRAGTEVTISVGDDGPGVAPEQRSTIFEMFQSVGATAGSGVGLAICKAISEAHGGTIAVGESAAGGAEFTVRIPA